MQIKTTLGFPLTPVTLGFPLIPVNVVKKKTSNDERWHGCGEGSTQLPLEDVQCSATIMEISMVMP